MPVDATLARVHLRVQSAGQSLERAVGFLRTRQVFRGTVDIRQAVQDLVAAQSVLAASGAYPELAAYVGTLVAYYQARVAKAVRPVGAPAIAAEIAASQGNLLAADPILFPNVAH